MTAEGQTQASEVFENQRGGLGENYFQKGSTSWETQKTCTEPHSEKINVWISQQRIAAQKHNILHCTEPNSGAKNMVEVKSCYSW